MRERMVQEREELLEYERMKQQQQLEIKNLRSVYDRLGDMVKDESMNHRATGTSGINPIVQQNLNSLLLKQQEDIMRLSQSGMKFKPPQEQYVQQPLQQPSSKPADPYTSNVLNLHQNYSPNVLEQSLSSDTKFVVVPQNKLAAQVQEAPTNLMKTWKEE